MFRMPLICRALTTSLLIFGLASATLFAGPVISFDPLAGGVRLVQKVDVDGEVTSQFLVKAKGASAVFKLHGTLTGVLFQATALPGDSLKSLPINLSYRLKGDHDAVLCVTLGNNQVTSDVPAWVWAVAAKFAEHEASGAVMLTDEPRTRAEKRFERRWHGKNGLSERLLWARYHPAVDDTLMGFFLLTADAMVGDPVHMRTITNGLKDFEKYSGYSLTTDHVKSGRAARALDTIISLEARPGDCAMLNDVDETIVFTISNGELRISGVPNYHFARETQAGVFEEIKQLTGICRKNRHLFLDVNPVVYKTIADFAKLVAFFNYIDETDPDRLDAFVNDLKPVMDRIPTIDAPIALPLPAR